MHLQNQHADHIMVCYQHKLYLGPHEPQLLPWGALPAEQREIHPQAVSRKLQESNLALPGL